MWKESLRSPILRQLSSLSPSMSPELVEPYGNHCMNCLRMTMELSCKECGSLYCEPGCQKTESYWHDMICPSLKFFRQRPGPSFSRAVYFPVDEDYPRLIWLEFKNEHSLDSRDFGTPKLTDLFGAASNSCDVAVYNNDPYHFQRLGRPI